MTDRKRLLQFNPGPIKVVPAAQRDVWTKKPGWRCDHEDGRGRCTSRETKAFRVSQISTAVEHYCARHAHEAQKDDA